ncbi:hypothetical protein NG797_05440 [Laspinema sp. D5]|nr:hypothetical protein [Laspinema sp. D3d]MCT7987376.1 hypothetical protein [Laspinema sp. D3a]
MGLLNYFLPLYYHKKFGIPAALYKAIHLLHLPIRCDRKPVIIARYPLSMNPPQNQSELVTD